MKSIKARILFIIGVIFINFVLCSLYSYIVDSESKQKFKVSKGMFSVTNKELNLNFKSSSESQLLRVKHLYQQGQTVKVFINGIDLIPNIAYKARVRGDIETDYFYLPVESIKSGINQLSIIFSDNQFDKVSVILTNYRRNVEDSIFVLFSDSKHLPLGNISLKVVIIITFITFCLFILEPYLLGVITFSNMFRFFYYQLYSILPFFIIFSIPFIFSVCNKSYKIVVTPNFFVLIGVLTFVLVQFCILLGLVLRNIVRHNYLSNQIGILRDFMNEGSLANKISSFNNFIKEDFSSKRISFLAKINILANLVSEILISLLEFLIVNLILLLEKLLILLEKNSKLFYLLRLCDKCLALSIASLVFSFAFLVLSLDKISEQFANLAFFILSYYLFIKSFKFVRSKKDR